jgi:hypothetical protein
VAEVVCADLQFEAVDRTLLRCSHHPGVVDQYVDLAPQSVGKSAYRGEVGKIKFANLTGTGNRRCGRLAFCHVAYGEHDPSTGLGEGLRRRKPYAAVSTGDDDGTTFLPRQVTRSPSG